MIVRVGFLVAASIAAYAVKQVNVKRPPSTSVKKSAGKDEEEEEKEEVKLISGLINVQPNSPDFEDDILPEFADLLSGEIDIPYDKDRVYEAEMANSENELERLRNLVKEFEEREVKLEGELLEYYGLKEQESDVVELQRQVKIKTVEIDMLNKTISTLQTERKKLQEEVLQAASYKKELNSARSKIKELQRQFQLEANQTKGQLLLLKQQVGILQTKEKDAVRKDIDIDKKLKTLKELEVDVVELKRKNRELQHEKRELVIKLDAAEARIATLSSTTETEMVANVREEVNKLKHTNEDLLKQVEGLQINRFSEVEELVYLRWVNACLRFELRNYETPAGKTSARDLNKNLSPRSQEKAKQLMLEYAGSERGQGGDTDLDSNFSLPSSPGSEDFDTASIDSSMSRYSSLSKKPSLIQKLKKWGKGKELVEFYQSLMKREAKKDTSVISTITSTTADARSNMIGEIENRSTFLLAVKADVETQGDFVESLASEVRAASFTDIEDLLAFVNWLDEELSFLVDERAVLKHFDWPEGKADALREAAFEYQDLMKLESQVTNFVDDPNLSCEAALKKMYKLLEKVENSVYALLRTRDMAMSRYKEFGIPVNWLQDSGVVGKIKLASVQLARKYMKRVASELDALDGPEKEPNREFLVLQGVRFAFRVHQFAGGFDAESMKAFEELRSRMNKQSNEENPPEA
ncbi:putative protein CHUP1 [Helianthus annuus]|nr:putative protein CHUP1 [Helianthus annuus]